MRLFLALGVVLSVALVGSASPASPAAATSSAARVTLEENVLRELNRVRRANGQSALRRSPELHAAALSHTRAMLRLGFIGHSSHDGTPFADRIRRFYPNRGFSTWSVAETLVVATAEMDARSIVKAWLNSPTHRAIALKDGWRDVGIGASFGQSGPGEFSSLPTLIVTADYGLRARKNRG